MITGIGGILTQAKGALVAAQVALNTSAKNVSNINTPGYSRQRVELQAGEATTLGNKGRSGGGVEIGGITRAASPFVDRRIVEENSSLGRLEGMSEILNQLEMAFVNDGENGISAAVTQVFNDFRTLSTQPDAMPLRVALKESANTLCNRFRSASESVDQVVKDADSRLEGSVIELNEHLSKIGKLNQQIMEIEFRGKAMVANDERDARDGELAKLAKLLPVEVTKTETGVINISSGRVGPLLNGTDAVQFKAMRADGMGVQGTLKVFRLNQVPGGKDKDISGRIDGGAIGGLLKVRDETVPALMAKIDSMASTLATEVNAIHRESFGRNGTKGIDFFDEPFSTKGAASMMAVSGDVANDVANIAAGSVANASGDNRALLRISDLQSAPLFDGGRASLIDVSAGMIGQLGVELRAVHVNMDAQKGLMDQLGNMKTEISGVSLDEEALDALKFQKAFDSSAKMIQMADQMLDTVINLKRF